MSPASNVNHSLNCNIEMFRFVFLLVLPFVLSPATAVSQRNATPVTITKTHYFDLSYSINNDTIYFPGQKVEFSLNKDIRGYTSGGYWYASYSFCMGEHGGTHLDSPVHFNKDGWTLDEIPANHLIDVPATIINVEQAVFGSAESPDKFLLEVHHLIEHESVHGEIPFRGVVLVHTGWAKYWPNKVKYLGWDNSTSGNGSQVLNFPGVSEEAAKWLANERGIVGLGIDTPSVDVGNNNVKQLLILAFILNCKKSYFIIMFLMFRAIILFTFYLESVKYTTLRM